MRAVALVAAAALSLGASGEDKVRREIEARYDLMAKAFAARDTAAIFALRTPDFCIHYPGGERDSATGARQVLLHFFSQNLPPIEVSYTLRSVTQPEDGVAVVEVFQQGSRTQILSGKSRRVKHEVTQRETWRRTKEGWLLASVDDIRDRHRWVDNVPVDPAKPFDPQAPPYRALK